MSSRQEKRGDGHPSPLILFLALPDTGPEMGAVEDNGAPAGQWEWFSPSRGRVMATEPKQRPVADGVDDWQLLTDAADADDGQS